MTQHRKKSKANLDTAKSRKQDEFYTRLCDIEKEMSHYSDQFNGKVIYCNCDNPDVSNFWKYFSLNFSRLGLKKLISTYYDSTKCSVDGCVMEDNMGTITTHDIKLTQSGDFRSQECLDLLSNSDVVITNPPFSLFREYIECIMNSGKKFIIMGNQNAVTYKNVFNKIAENKIWMGVNNGRKWFRVPDSYDIVTTDARIIDGHNYIQFGNVVWYTNMVNQKRYAKLILHNRYNGNESLYPKYDNYDAIEVSRLKDIPIDYSGVMGVPITFLDKYNPDFFEIIGFRKGNNGKDLTIKGKQPYFRVLIKKKDGAAFAY